MQFIGYGSFIKDKDAFLYYNVTMDTPINAISLSGGYFGAFYVSSDASLAQYDNGMPNTWDEASTIMKTDFNNTCNGFFDRLIEKHPKLTNSDLRLCAYIRLNLSTKEIASLMNVSSSSVEMAKYRLRKKLELDESIALPYYLTEVIATLKSFVND